MIQKYRIHQKSTFRLKMSIWSLFICLSILIIQPGAYAADEYLLLDPVISNAGGNISLDDLNMGIFAGLPLGDSHLDIPPNYQTILGSGYVLWEHMLRNISGQVINEKGEGVANVTIEIRKTQSDDHRLVIYAQTKTDADGHYIITRLPARDDLTIYADPTDTYLSQFYNDKESWELADALSTLPGSLENMNMILHEPPENGISGQIFDQNSAGMATVNVTLLSESIGISKTTQTDINGLYEFRGIMPGSDYRIKVWSSQYQTDVYYQSESTGVTDPSQSTPITVADILVDNIHLTIHPDFIIYYISAIAGENGQINPSGKIAVPYQGNQSFLMQPTDGAIIEDVIIDGISHGAISQYTMTQIQRQGHSITVTFTFPSIQSQSGPNGRIEPDGTFQVKAGDNQSFNIFPDADYEIQEILIDGISIGPRDSVTLSDIQKHYTIEAIFKERERFDFNITFDSGGTLQVQTGESKTLTLTSDKSPYPLTVFKNDTVFIDIQAEQTNYIKDIRLDSSSLDINSSIVIQDIQQAHQFYVSFLPIIIETHSSGNGTIDPSGTLPLSQGQNQTFTISPEPGHFIEALTIDGQSIAPVQTFTFWDVKTEHTLDVTFQAHDPLTLTITAGEGGSITVLDYRQLPIQGASGPKTYTIATLPESRIILTLEASNGYQLSNVTLNGESKGNASELILDNIQATYDIMSYFKRLPVHTITANASEGGKLTPSGTLERLTGEHTHFDISPDPGYHIKDVSVDGQSMGPISQYVLPVTGDAGQSHAITATFEENAIREVSGQIVFEQTPVKDAIIYLSFPEKIYTTTSNESGQFSFTQLPSLDQGQMWVDPGNNYTKEYFSDNVSIKSSNLTGIDISVQRIYQGKIKGKIQFSAMNDKNPGVMVQAISDSDRDYLIATTDASGFYTFTQMLPGAYIVVVQDTDLNTDFYYSKSGTVFSALDADYISLGVDAISDAVDITLTPGGTIQGMVHQADNTEPEALANILVTARSLDDASSQSTFTDEYGVYTITGLNFISEHSDYTHTGYIVEVPPINYQYQAYPQAAKPGDAKAIYTGIKGINFNLIPYATISGIISGPPNARMDIITRSLSNPGVFAETQVVLSDDGQGEYTLTGLISGDDYVLTVYPENYPVLTHSQQIDISYGSQTDIQMTIDPGTTLIGTVTDDTENTIASANVQVFYNNALFRESLSDENGHYTITGLLNETYSIQLDHPNRLNFSQDIDIVEPENQVFNIMLNSGYVFSGKVTFNENVVPGIQVNISNDVTYRETTIQEDGTYTLTGLLPGLYTVTISGPTYEPIIQTVIIENNDITEDFPLIKAYRYVSGYIYNMNKNETARIRAWSANGSDKTLNVEATHDNEPVSFKINGLLASDDYIIEVKSTEHPLHLYNDKFGLKKADKLNLALTNADNLVFSLVPPYVIEGTINIPAFPVNVIETSVLVHATAEYYASEGIATLDFISPGTQSFTVTLLVNSNDYLVSVQSEHFVNHFFENASKEISATLIDTMAPVPIHFTMTGGASISGTIVDKDGNPKKDLFVLAWSQQTGSQGSTRTNENGEFIVMGLVQSDDFLVQTWNEDNVTFFYNTDQQTKKEIGSVMPICTIHYYQTTLSNHILLAVLVNLI